MVVPQYRMKEIKRLYDVFDFKSDNLTERKQEFKRVLHIHYKWASASELNEFYNFVYEKEVSFEIAKRETEAIEGVKDDIVKLFGSFDKDKNGVIDYYEFVHQDEHIQELFAQMDVNRDGQVSIEEFVDFIRNHAHIIETMKVHIKRVKDTTLSKRINNLSVLFKKFPFSPTTPGSGWRPALNALHSPVTLHQKCLASEAFPNNYSDALSTSSKNHCDKVSPPHSVRNSSGS